jgi:hypothetical protein
MESVLAQVRSRVGWNFRGSGELRWSPGEGIGSNLKVIDLDQHVTLAETIIDIGTDSVDNNNFCHDLTPISSPNK